MKRNVIGGHPYAMTKEGSITVLRFFPKSPNAKDPDDDVLVLKLSETDKQTLIRLLS